MTKNQNHNVQSEGTSFLGLLTLLFIGLKLTKHIDWPWYWVLSPILIPVGLVLSCLLIYVLYWLILTFVKTVKSKLKNDRSEQDL